MTTPSLLNWMWQSTLCLGAGWLLYYLLLRRESCFGFNRGLLLLAPLVAAVAPLLPWAQWWPVAAVVHTVGVPYAVLPALRVGATASAEPALNWVLMGYLAGVAVSLVRLSLRLFRLWRLSRRLPAERHAGYTLRRTGGRLPISSFGRTVYWDDAAGLSPDDARQVLAHELAHVRLGHTADRLWLQLWQAALWFNPLIYRYLRALELTHEYQADAEALRQNARPTPATYAGLLARQATRQWTAPALTHAFTTSYTLNRIAMLHHHHLTRAWRKWAVLPVAAAVLGLVACEQINAFGPPPPPPAPEAPLAPPPPPPQLVPPPPPPPAPTAEKLPEYHGGLEKLMQDLARSIRYPQEAAAMKAEGKVFVQLTIDADGAMQDVKVVKAAPKARTAGISEQLDAEALRAVKALPGPWTPAREGGQPVASQMVVPVAFALK